MDQRSDYIRQDIESTRASLDEKLDSLESKARQTFDVKHQVSERPWMALGAAVAAGYVLGSLGSDSDDSPRYSSQSGSTLSNTRHEEPGAISSAVSSFASQFDDEIDMIKGAAIAALTGFLRDTVKEYVPMLSSQLDQTLQQRGKMPSTRQPGKTPSTAQGASSYYDERSNPPTNTEAIPTTTSYGSNLVDQGSEHAKPYYPPGSNAPTEASDYVKTYNPPSERSVADDKTRY